jgi:hypothetical protein
LILFLINLSSCKKEDPNPELRDQIYQDIVAQEGDNLKAVADIEKKIEEAKKAVLDSKPQTGEVKRSTKKVFELENLRTRLKQQETFWKIRKFERLKFVRRNKPEMSEEDWNNRSKSEYEQYMSEKKLRQAKNSWDLKQRFRDEGLTYDPILMGEEPKVEKKEAPPAGGGGH